jgi:hypothetical protein
MRQLSKLSSLVAAIAALVVLSFTPVRGSDGTSGGNKITIKRVFTGWKDGASFKRISEYFTGQENTDDTVVLRTHPEQRSGFYFFIRVSNPGAPAPVKINLELITPTDTKPKTYSFSSELKTGQNLFNLGLTAGDWPDEKAHPVAWKIDFVGSDNQVLVSRDSYLWEKPATP